MMEKNLTMSRHASSSESMQRTVTGLRSWLCAPLRWLKQYYSGVMGRPLSNRQVWLLVKVQLAFLLTVFCTGVPVLCHVLLGAWLLYELIRCRMEFGE